MFKNCTKKTPLKKHVCPLSKWWIFRYISVEFSKMYDKIKPNKIRHFFNQLRWWKIEEELNGQFNWLIDWACIDSLKSNYSILTVVIYLNVGTIGIKKNWKLVKILLALIIFYNMNTDNDALLKFWFHSVVCLIAKQVQKCNLHENINFEPVLW